MIRHHFTILILFLTAVFVASSSLDGNLSNSQRLAKGLGPNKPKRLYDASRIHAAPARRSAVAPDSSQGQNIAVGSPFERRKRGGGLSYLMVNPDGSLGSTTDQSRASLFMPPASGSQILQWIPTSSAGSFVPGNFYTMFATTNNGVSTLQFANPLPNGAVTNLFSSTAPFSGGFSPQIGDTAVQWIMNSDGTMYMASSLGIALAVLPGAQSVVAQSFKPGTTPTIDQAKGVTNSAPINPTKLYATTQAGDIQGYIMCSSDGSSVYIGRSSDSGNTFYLPNLGSTNNVQAIETVINGNVYSLTETLVDPPRYSISMAPGTGSSIPGLAYFTIPSSGQGLIKPQIGSDTGFFALAIGRGPVICAPGQCSTSRPMCFELVNIGGSPGACQAYFTQQTLLKLQTNPVRLYATKLSSDGKSVVSNGWVTATTSGLTLSSKSGDTATTFYLPNFGNGAKQPMYMNNNGVVNIVQLYVQNQYLGLGAQPSLNASLALAVNSQRSTAFITLNSLSGSIVTGDPGSAAAAGWLWYSGDKDNALSLFTSLATARSYDATTTQVCLESVQPGQQPTGMCNPTPQTSFPKCSPRINVDGGFAAGNWARVPYGTMISTVGVIEVQRTPAEGNCMVNCANRNPKTSGACFGLFWPNNSFGNCYLLTKTGYNYNSLSTGVSDGKELAMMGTCASLQAQNILPNYIMANCCDN